MASIQKKRDRFAAELIRKNIPFEHWNAIDDDAGRLCATSNAVGLSLSAFNAAAGIFSVGFSALLILARIGFGSFFSISGIQDRSSVLYYALLLSSYVVSVFVPMLLLLFLLRRSPVRDVAAKPVHRPLELIPAAVVTMGAYFAGILATEGISFLLGLIHLTTSEPDFTMPSALTQRILYIVMICGFAPLMEEFVFRGVILQALRRYGDLFAVVISSLLFAMLHGNLVQAPFAFVVGLALGYFVLRFGSVWATVPLHACVNSISVVTQLAEPYWSNTVLKTAFAYGIGPFVLLLIFCVVYFILRPAKGGPVLRGPASRIPAGMRARRFFLTPGFWLFAGISIVTIALYLRIS